MANTAQGQAEQGISAVREVPADDRDLYDSDFFSWAERQAALMRRREYAQLDWENVIEEVAYLARRERRRWTSLYAPTVQHMLKILHDPGQSADTWRQEVLRKFRKPMKRELDSNPGLKGKFTEMQNEGWTDGRSDAIDDLVGYAAGRGASEQEQDALRRELAAAIPETPQWDIGEVAAYNPWHSTRKEQPDENIWPAEVAQRLNRLLGKNYPECGWVADSAIKGLQPREAN